MDLSMEMSLEARFLAAETHFLATKSFAMQAARVRHSLALDVNRLLLDIELMQHPPVQMVLRPLPDFAAGATEFTEEHIVHSGRTTHKIPTVKLVTF